MGMELNKMTPWSEEPPREQGTDRDTVSQGHAVLRGGQVEAPLFWTMSLLGARL